MTPLSPALLPDIASILRKNTKALIADDEPANRDTLKSLLSGNGYLVVEAGNGREAVELFQKEQPDIVFMDVAMPEMDGYQAVQQIRALTPNRFVPILFLTDLSDEESLVRCITAGGDDFLTKPFNRALLSAKIYAMQRINEVHQQVSSLYNRLRQDQIVAEKVFSGAVVADNIALDKIETLLQPAEIFSGDVLLTAYSPARDINILLGDFTGHGLAAALGALPTSEVFRAMTNKGFSPAQILAGINQKLLSLMPTGMFFAAQFISVDKRLDHVTICNCGMPDILVLDGATHRIKHRSKATSLPLGISREIQFPELLEHVKIERGDRVILVSDGVTEAIDPNHEQFGMQRFEAAITQPPQDGSVLRGVRHALQEFCRDATQLDDISLVAVPCVPHLLPEFDSRIFGDDSGRPKMSRSQRCDAMEFTLTLRGSRLRDADPVPLIINHVQELEGIDNHRRLLFTILTELYVNALDHGVLQLDSGLKSSPDGFTRYFEEREKRLAEISEGHIRISVQTHPMENGGEVVINLEDSGPGFDFTAYLLEMPEELRPSGRGIRLLLELCDSVTFEPPGNRVEAVYSWINS